ncbi:nucleotidyltransferase [Thermococci archaeon]|nr:MAG: nucleotidyltransferase [Thermococci archaeon]RLG00388.1 MAG: nucleotidyltransferase [Thermococci archaeon]
MKEKIVKNYRGEIVYSNEKWELLWELREKALEIMKLFTGYYCIAYGSITRGDVNKKSDIDIFVETESHILEIILKDFKILERKIVQATPWQAIKGTIILEDNIEISFPMCEIKKKEEEFYHFGGALTYKEMKEKKRVCGVNKKLLLIIPTESGHIESSIIGKESETAKLLNLSINTVQERIKVLSRRDKIGRTGVYLQRVLAPEENFGEVLKKIIDKDVNVRRRFL